MYRLNDEQQKIAASAAAIADRELAPRAADVDRDAAFPKDSIAALGAKGLLGLNVPAKYGGLGQGPRTAAAVIDAVAHLGVRHIDMPTTPQRVWTAINEAQKASHQ